MLYTFNHRAARVEALGDCESGSVRHLCRRLPRGGGAARPGFIRRNGKKNGMKEHEDNHPFDVLFGGKNQNDCNHFRGILTPNSPAPHLTSGNGSFSSFPEEWIRSRAGRFSRKGPGRQYFQLFGPSRSLCANPNYSALPLWPVSLRVCSPDYSGCGRTFHSPQPGIIVLYLLSWPLRAGGGQF